MEADDLLKLYLFIITYNFIVFFKANSLKGT